MASKVPELVTQCIGLTRNGANTEGWRHIYPNDITRARRFFTNKRRQPELVKAGVLVRIQKELVVMVPAYLAYLARHTREVASLKIKPNTPPYRHTRFGGAKRPEALAPGAPDPAAMREAFVAGIEVPQGGYEE